MKQHQFLFGGERECPARERRPQQQINVDAPINFVVVVPRDEADRGLSTPEGGLLVAAAAPATPAIAFATTGASILRVAAYVILLTDSRKPSAWSSRTIAVSRLPSTLLKTKTWALRTIHQQHNSTSSFVERNETKLLGNRVIEYNMELSHVFVLSKNRVVGATSLSSFLSRRLTPFQVPVDVATRRVSFWL